VATGEGSEEVAITLRDAFVAPKGCILLTADYSQLELRYAPLLRLNPVGLQNVLTMRRLTRLMAHFSKDELLISTLKAGGDLFIMIASQWLNKDPSLVTKQERTHVRCSSSAVVLPLPLAERINENVYVCAQAKGMCYGILYGMGAHSLSEQLEVTPEEAAVFLDKFKQTYKGYSIIVFVAEQESVVLFVHANTYNHITPP
jgi:DNA polymerase I-like protein with 3'-5' exonuclease and polymerase domains